MAQCPKIFTTDDNFELYSQAKQIFHWYHTSVNKDAKIGRHSQLMFPKLQVLPHKICVAFFIYDFTLQMKNVLGVPSRNKILFKK